MNALPGSNPSPPSRKEGCETASVRRGGRAGDAGFAEVPIADMRLIEATDLFINQAPLTGESLPAAKFAEPDARPRQSAFELTNICFMSTNVVSGLWRRPAAVHGAAHVFWPTRHRDRRPAPTDRLRSLWSSSVRSARSSTTSISAPWGSPLVPGTALRLHRTGMHSIWDNQLFAKAILPGHE